MNPSASDSVARIAIHPDQLESVLRALPGVQSGALSVGHQGVEQVAMGCGYYCREINTSMASFTDVLRRQNPAVLQLMPDKLLVVRSVKGAWAEVLQPDGGVCRIRLLDIRNLFEQSRSSDSSEAASDLRCQSEVSADCPPQWRVRLHQRKQAAEPIAVGWRLEPARQDHRLSWRLISAALLACGAHLLQFLVWIGTWLVLARLLFSQSYQNWLLVWGGALASSVVLLVLARWLTAKLALQVGFWTKQRLLARLLRQVTPQAAQTLGRAYAAIIDANRLDGLIAYGGVSAFLGGLELVVVLGLGAYLGMVFYSGLLLVFCVILLVLTRALYDARRNWHRESLAVTALHAEELVAQRTRKTLFGKQTWHTTEDECLHTYLQSSAQADRAHLRLLTLPRWWMLIAMTSLLVNATAQGTATSSLVEALGFVLLSFLTLQTMIQGLIRLVDAAIGAQAFVSMTQQTGDHQVGQSTTAAPSASTASDASAPAPLWLPTEHALRQPHSGLWVQQLYFTYRFSERAVLDGVSFQLQPGSRTILEGASGGGKSTLANVLAARLMAQRGAVMFNGMDIHALGVEQWRRLVSYVPQHHQNYVFTETLLFNLLLGAQWPPGRQQMQRVMQVVALVGLSDVIERMPAGLQQVVGDGGWQLSQGECARLFIARGLLQSSEVLMVDEPLASLDPPMAIQLLNALRAEVPTLLMIAHR